VPRLAPLRAAAEASVARREGERRRRVRIGLLGSPAQPLLLTVFDGWSGAPLARVAVEAATAAQGGVEVEVPAGTHRVTLARDAAGARSSYLTAAALADGGEPPRLDVESGMAEVTVRAPQGAPAVGVVVTVERVGDPGWRPPLAAGEAGALAISDARGIARVGPLGAGRYRLRTAAGPRPEVEIDFPATRTATLALTSDG
jgi:hypothetical protein